MPELPEVEIHARNLRRWLTGRRIAGYEALDPLLTAEQDISHWKLSLAGKQVLGVDREAKYLLIRLEGDHTLAAHLRMTGRFVYDSYAARPAPRFTRLTLRLDQGDQVRFEDRRRFGRVWIVPTDSVRQLPELADLGPDALVEALTAERLRELTSGTRRSIKALLMDQRVVGGIGNICAVEILYRAGIAPETPANRLTDEQVSLVARLIPEFLEWAIETQSRRELLYIGEKGSENVFTIYRRAGTPCPQCETPIVRTVVAGRGTYSCPTCQR
ncbi:MAG: bifunctional DNA-formamidopyrimidine glycosylase/DNA-(apurinic or apyrimidinic site) lyase [Actinomycetota bacterium]